MKSVASAVGLAMALAGLVLASETLQLTRRNPHFVSDLGGGFLLVVAIYSAFAIVTGIAIGTFVRATITQAFLIAGTWYLIISLKILWVGARLLTKPPVAVAFVVGTVLATAAVWFLVKRFKLSFSFPFLIVISYTNVGLAVVAGWAEYGGSLHGFLRAGHTVAVATLGAVAPVAATLVERSLARRWERHAPAGVLGAVAFVIIVGCMIGVKGAPGQRSLGTAARNAEDIYVLSFDALRADTLSTYLASHPDSQLAKLVATSASFENVASRGPSTLATLAENTFGGAVSTKCADSLPSVLETRGYFTAMYLGFAGHRFDGSSCYRDYFSGEGSSLLTHYSLVGLASRVTHGSTLNRDKYLPAASLLARLRSAAKRTEPVFAYMHFLEMHAPYSPRSRDGQRGFVTAMRSFMVDCAATGCDATDPRNAELIATARTAYTELVDELDAVVGSVLEIAKQRGRPFRLVVTSDHGELFGEYGAFTHRFGFVPELRRVPFVVHDSAAPNRSQHCELMTSSEAMRATLLREPYRDHARLDLDVPEIGSAAIDREAATITFELSPHGIANSGVSRNMHRESRGTIPYPITRCP